MNKQAELTRWTPKRLLSLLMALIMTLSLLPTAAFADNDSKLEFDSKNWSDTDKNQTLVTAEAEGGKVEVSLDNFDLTAEDLKPGVSFTLPLKVDGTRPKNLKNYAYFVTIDRLSFGQTKLDQNFSYTHLFNLNVGQDDGLIHFTVTVTLYPNGRDAEPATSISQSVVMKTDYAERHYQIYYSTTGKTADGNRLPDGVTVTLNNCSNGQTTTKVGSTVENGFLQEYRIPATATASAEGYTFRCWAPENAPWTKSGKTISHITGNRTLYPVFNNNESSTDHTVTYDTAGGNFPDGISFNDETTTGTSYVIPEDAKSIKSGFTFTGWKVGDNAYVPGNTIENINNGITLVAQYAENFTITFESEYPNVSGLRKSATSTGTTYTVPNLPKMYGYTFKGWKVTFTDTNQVVNNQECVAPGMQITGITNGVTLTALWEDSDSSTSASSHTITFYENGTGVYNMPANQTVSNGKKATAPVVEPQRDGYTFHGWYTNAACTGAAYTFTEAVTADVALFAKWVAETVTVTFPAATGSVGTTDVLPAGVSYHKTMSTPTTRPVAKGSDVTFRLFLDDASLDPATLHVYANGAELLGTSINSYNNCYEYTVRNVTVDTKITVYPPHTKTFNVTLPSGERFDAAFTSATKAVTPEDEIKTSTKVVVEHGGSVSFTVTEREGWTIKNVYDNGTAIKAVNGKYTISNIQADHQITVNVEQTIFYNVTYAVPGSSWTQSYQSGTKLGTPGMTTGVTKPATVIPPTGYTWDGNWYKDADYKTPITDAAPLTVTGDVTVYAKFAPKTVSISYMSGNEPAKVNDVEIPATSKIYGLGAQLTADIPTNAPGEGYTFLGWSENPSATAPAYKSGEMYNVDTAEAVTLYAVWEKQTFNISLSSGTGYSIHHTQPLQVEYGDTFSFRVAMSKGYSQTAPSVWMNWVDVAGEEHSHRLTNHTETTDGTSGLAVYHYTTPEIYWNATINVASAADNVYTVTYKYAGLDGRTESPKNEDTYLTQNVSWNEAAAQPAAPSVEGYKFVGWYTDNKTTPYVFATPVTSDLTIYAVFSAVQPTITRTKANTGTGWETTGWKWTKGTKINAVANGGGAFSVDYGSDVEFTLNIEEGYNASGVTVSVNGKLLLPYGDATVDGNVTKITYKLTNVTEDSEIVVGGVTRKEVKITYYANATDDVEHVPGQQTVKYFLTGNTDNGKLDKATPTRVGYEFKGWSTDPAASPDAANLYQPGGDATFTSDTNLYAIWKATSTTVTLTVSGLRTDSKGEEGQYEGKDITLTATIAKAGGLGTPGGSMRFYKKTIDGTTVLIETVPVTGEKVTLTTAVDEFINQSNWTEQYWVEYFPEEGKGFATSKSTEVSVRVWSTTISWRISGASIAPNGDVLTIYENKLDGQNNVPGGEVADGKMIAGNVYWLEIPEVLALNGGNDPTIGHGYEIRWEYMDDSGSWREYTTTKDSDMVMIDADHSRYSFRANVVPTDPFTKAVDYDENGNLIDNKYNNAGLYTKQTKYVALQSTTTTLAVTGADNEAGDVYINGTQPFGTVGSHLAQFEGQTVTLTATVVDASKAAVTKGYVNFYKNNETTPMNEQPIAIGQNGTATYQATTSAFSGDAINAKDNYYAVYLSNDTYSTSDSMTDLKAVYIKSTAIQTPIIESTLANEANENATTYTDDLTGLLAGVEHTFTLRTGNAKPDWSVVALDGRTVDAKNYTIQWITKSGDNAETTAATDSKFKTSDNKVGDEIYVRLNPTGDMKTGADSKKAIIGTKQGVKVTVEAIDAIDKTPTAKDVYQLNEIELRATVTAADAKASMQPDGLVQFYYVDDNNFVEIGKPVSIQTVGGARYASIKTNQLPVTAVDNTKRDVKITAVYLGDTTFKASDNWQLKSGSTTEWEVTAADITDTVKSDTVTVYSSVVFAGDSENKATTTPSTDGITITANGKLKANEAGVTLTLGQVYTLDHPIDLSKLTYNTDYTVQWQILENALQHQDSGSAGSYASTTAWKDLSGQTGMNYTGTMEQDAAYRAKITVKDTPIAKGSFTKVDQAIKGRDVYYSNVLVVGVGMATVTTNITTSANQKFNEEGIVSGETATIHVLASGAAKTTPISTVTATITKSGATEPVFNEKANNVNGYTSFAWDTANLTPGYYTLTVTAESNNGYAPQTITRTLIVRDNAYTLSATTISKVYNGKAQGIDWELTGVDIEDALAQKSVVVYYYDKDGKMVEPTQAGEYQYDLYLPASAYWTELEHVSGTFTIEKRPVEVVDLVAQAKVYDGTNNANIQEIILNDSAVDSDGTATGDKGIIDGDSVYAVGTGYTSKDTAGTDATLGVKDVSLKGDDAANYTLSASGYTEVFNIQRSQVKGAIVSGRTYKYTGKDIKLAASDIYLIDQAGNQLTNYDVTYYYHNGDGVEKVDAMNKMGKYTVIARPEQDNYKGGATETVYVGNTDTPGTLNNGAKSSLITISNTVELYGATNGVTVSATKGTATASYYYNNGTSADWHTDFPANAGRYLVKVTTSTGDTAYGLYTVVKARPALTLTATGATYNSAQYNGAPTGTYNGGALPAGTYFTYTGGTIQGVAYEAPTEAGDYVVTAHVGKTPNYTAHEISTNFTIAKAALTIKADDLQRWQYGSFPDMVASYQGLATGGVAADTSLRDVQIQPEFLFNEQKGGYTNHAYDQVGTYPVTVRNALARNYTVTYVGGTIATTAEEPKAELAIHGMPDNGTPTENLVYYGDTIQLYAYGYYKTLDSNTSSGSYNTSSLIEWSVSDASIAEIDQSGLLTIKGVGTFTVTLTRGSGSAAISTDINVEAKPKEVSIDVPDVDKVYTASEQTYNGTVTVNGLINSDSVTPTVTTGTDKRTVVGSQITSYKVPTTKYVSETYGGLFTINVKDVDIKPTAADTIYGTRATGLTFTKETPAGSDKVLADDKTVSVADAYGNLDVYNGYEILVAGKEDSNYNVHYQTKNDREVVGDVNVKELTLTISTGTLKDQIGMTSGSLNPMGKYPVNGAAIDDPAPAMGPSNVRMYGEPNWVMDEELPTLISGDTLADLAALGDKLVKFNYNIGADANVSYTDKTTKLTVSGSAMSDYEVLTDASKMAFKNYNETYTLGTQNIYQRPVTLSVPSGMTLTAYKPSILDSSNQVKNDVLLNLLLNNLIVSKYNNEGGLAELLKHTIKDLDIRIKSTQVTGDKLTVKIALGNQNYWLNSANEQTFEITLVTEKIVPKYSTLDWTSFSVTMYDAEGKAPVSVNGAVNFYIFKKKDGADLKYSDYKNDPIIRSGPMTPTGSTGQYVASFERLPAGEYAYFAIAQNYTIVE